MAGIFPNTISAGEISITAEEYFLYLGFVTPLRSGRLESVAFLVCLPACSNKARNEKARSPAKSQAIRKLIIISIQISFFV
jgi:hypothetical protein